LTVPETVVERHGVHIIGYVDLPSRLAPTASLLYGNNLVHLLTDMGGGTAFNVNPDDAVIRNALVVHNGEITWPPPRTEPPPVAAAAPARAPVEAAPLPPLPAQKNPVLAASLLVLAGAALIALGLVAPPAFLSHLTVFALACVVGWQVIWNVTPALHTPLMSVTNAISGIIVIGGVLQLNGPVRSPAVLLGAAAILLSTINVAGGFLVTQRMLRMFQR
jgi:proton-translocating NAD(P)+ transhydrogenase subunit alpha